jgi:hypothetical protein
LYRLSDKNPLGYRPWTYRVIILEIHLNVEFKIARMYDSDSGGCGSSLLPVAG